jgi:hypothetical protein
LTPPSSNILKNIINKESITNQRLRAFNRGNIISDELSIKGIKILPKPPINKGIIIKKIINKPWKVIIELYCIEEHIINPGKLNSILINIDNPKPKEPPIHPAIIYTPPIKIWFVVINNELRLDKETANKSWLRLDSETAK